MTGLNRLPGHALRLKGAAHAHDGQVRVWNKRHGRALCECGALSPELPSTYARKGWHSAHKDAIREQWRRSDD